MYGKIESLSNVSTQTALLSSKAWSRRVRFWQGSLLADYHLAEHCLYLDCLCDRPQGKLRQHLTAFEAWIIRAWPTSLKVSQVLFCSVSTSLSPPGDHLSLALQVAARLINITTRAKQVPTTAKSNTWPSYRQSPWHGPCGCLLEIRSPSSEVTASSPLYWGNGDTALYRTDNKVVFCRADNN